MNVVKQSRGFSSVELMVALSLLCILVGFVFLSTQTLKHRNNDTKRVNDIDSIHKNLESYFAKKALYPTLDNMNDKSWLKTNMSLLDYESLRDPLGTVQMLADTPVGNQYSYTVTSNDGKPCDNGATQCKKYTLTAIKQESRKFYTKGNIN